MQSQLSHSLAAIAAALAAFALALAAAGVQQRDAGAQTLGPMATSTAISFGAQSIPDLVWTAGERIVDFQLPESTGGVGLPQYSLSPSLPNGIGREAQENIHHLHGTPNAAFSKTQFAWTAADANGVSVSLTFHITVQAAPDATHTPTPIPTATHTPTPIPTATHTPTPIPTATHTPTPIPTATHTPTPIPTATHTPTPIPTATPTAPPRPRLALPRVVIPFAPPDPPTPTPTSSPTPTPGPEPA